MAERSSTVAGRISTFVLITIPVYCGRPNRPMPGAHNCDLSEPGKSDRIEDTVDYRQVRAIAQEVIEGESQNLLETLAARIADRVLQLPRVGGVSVRISKRPASMRPIAAAAVRINRTRA